MIVFLAGVAVGVVLVWAIVELGARRRRDAELRGMYRRAGVDGSLHQRIRDLDRRQERAIDRLRRGRERW